MKKKLKLFLVVLFLLVININKTKALDTYNIKIDAYLNQQGDMHIIENFSAKADEDNKICKYFDLKNNQKISNITIYMDEEMLSKFNFDEEINELCLEDINSNQHQIILDYTISNMIFKTEEEDILYWKIFNEITADNLNLIIMGYYDFDNNVIPYSFGYSGNSFITDGKIYTSNQEKITNGYTTFLVKFPKDTFDTENKYEEYPTFDKVLNEITNKNITFTSEKNKKIFFFVIGYIGFLLILISIIILNKNIQSNKYGYKNNITIDKEKLENITTIPKNIYYSNALLKLNNLDYIKTNLFGAMLCKLIAEDKISISNNKINLSNKNKITNEYEKELINLLSEASKDEYLSITELEKWSKDNYSRLLNLFTRITNDSIKSLEDSCRIYKRKFKKECKYPKVMDGVIYKDSTKLYSLEKYLDEYIKKEISIDESKIKDYLPYSFLFGISNKFIKKITSNYQEYEVYNYINTFNKKIINYVKNIEEEEKEN